jgi:hypothetical protein
MFDTFLMSTKPHICYLQVFFMGPSTKENHSLGT